jgi:zinc protease
MARFFIRLVLILAVFLASVPTAAAESVDYRLPNGLRVVLLENHRAPVVSMLVWVKTGGASERPGEYGLAHVLEHMLFKGTPTRAPGRIAREIEESGGDINASTSSDATIYHLDIAGRFADKGLDVLADMLFHSSFDPVEFEKEKEVVLEEIRRGRDNPDSRLSEALFETAYRVHPYRRTVIGTFESVQALSRAKTVDFYRRQYRPGNMVLVVAGDFSPSTLKPLIDRAFGRAPAGKAPVDQRPPEPPQKGLRTNIIRAQVNAASWRLAWHIPESRHPDSVALDLLAMVLGEGRTSRLFRQVKHRRSLVHGISAGAYTPRDSGLFLVSARTEPGDVRASMEAALAEIEIFKARGLEPGELDRNKRILEAQFIHSRATMSGEASVAASFEVTFGDFKAKEKYLDQVNRLTPEDLIRVANTYLTKENLTAALALPEQAESGLDEKALVQAVTAGSAPVSAPAVQPAEKLQEFTLKNGLRLYVKPDHSLPLAALRLAFLGGTRYETDGNQGLFNLLAEVWDRGTTRLPPEDLARETEDLAAEIASFSGRNSFGLEAEFLSRNLDQGLGLFAEVLTTPALDPAEVEKAKADVLAAIGRREDQPASQAFVLFGKTMFQGHPYARETTGTRTSVPTLTAQDLRAAIDKYARPEGAVLVVVGDVDPEKLKDRLDGLLSGWTGRPEPTPDLAVPEKWEGIKDARLAMDREQRHLVLGFPAPGLDSPDRYALDVLEASLSGQGGRLFVELRDKQSLAYSLSAFFSPGLGLGSFGLYIGYDPAKQDQVTQGFEYVLKALDSQPLTDQEIRAAKEYLLGGYEIGLQKNSAQAAEIAFNALYGLGADYSTRYTEAVAKVTGEDIARVVKTYLNLGQAVRVTVGPGV